MTTEFESLVLEHLRAIQADVAEIKARVGRVELRLTAIDHTLGSALSENDRETAAQWLIRRVEHINGARN
ncbi:hypothetical protein [uncultured Thiodictyon sp.]|uniref:hypothetical protein n=1 Tax=uncultured Thiodictyon sp. TaxID=1846217 RepID=UPI0025DD455E|nr:hypothetical protein [uncultured Thiodictyon sp.]